MEQINENPSAVGKTKPHSPESPKRNYKFVFWINIKDCEEQTCMKLKYECITDFTTDLPGKVLGKRTVIYFAE